MSPSIKFLSFCVLAACFCLFMVGTSEGLRNVPQQASDYVDGVEYETGDGTEPNGCNSCFSEETIRAKLDEKLVRKDKLLDVIAGKINTICSNPVVKAELKALLAKLIGTRTCPPAGGCSPVPPPPTIWYVCQIESKPNSALTRSTIKEWIPGFCTHRFTSLNNQGIYSLPSGARERTVVFDFAVRCDCRGSLAIRRDYATARRRKRETGSPYDVSAGLDGSPASSSVYDPAVQVFRMRRATGTGTVYSCGTDSCVGRKARVEVYKDDEVIRAVEVSNLCFVDQSFKVATTVHGGSKVFLKLRDASLIPTSKCTWTITAAYLDLAS